MASKPPYVIPYDTKFLGDEFTVPMPLSCCKGKLVQSGKVFDYIHYSLVMHQERRSALYTAHNIDYGLKRRASGGSWDTDSRMNTAFQTDNDAYRNNPWDRGHLVRRDAVVWGSTQQEAEDANDSTYFYTNAALQHRDFNQNRDTWLGLEDWILQKAGGFASKLCVFTGPIYTEVDEKTPKNYVIPSAFFKVVVLKDPTANGNDLSAIAFMMKQNENWRSAGPRALTNLQPYTVSINEIEAYTGLDFGELAELDEFDWRQIRFRNRAMMAPIPVNGPDDIEFNGNLRRARGIRATRSLVSGQILDQQHEVSSERSGKGCGCKNESMELEREVIALKKQTTALAEILETLLENNNGNFSERALGLIRTKISRIIGGQAVGPGEFLHCVAIGDEFEYFCTGVLVHPRIILTAAHCADFPITRVLLNARQVSDRNGDIMAVESVIIHPEYSQTSVPWNDIAVVILQEDANVLPIEIATKEEVSADDSLILVGFGSDDPNGIAGFGTKRRVDVPLTLLDSRADVIASQNEHGYDATSEFHGGGVGDGKDSCSGDSGGPAYIITADGMLKVAGLTSRAALSSIDICGDGGIYTLIDAYSDWLYDITGERIGERDETEPREEPNNVTTDGLYISKVVPNPEGIDAGNEWIEITNAGSAAVSLEGFFIEDRQGNGRHPLGGTLAAGDSIQITFPSSSPIKLGNSGDDVKLLSGVEIVHEVTYANAASGQVFLFDAPVVVTDDPEPEEEEPNEVAPGEEDPCGCGKPPSCDHPIDHNFTPGAIRC